MRGYCSMEGGRRLFLGELPLRGAARLREAGGQEEAASGGGDNDLLGTSYVVLGPKLDLIH